MVQKTLLWSAIVASFASISTVLASDSDVLTLTDKTFKDQVMDKDLMLVEFFAPWCGHCKALGKYKKEGNESRELTVVYVCMAN